MSQTGPYCIPVKCPTKKCVVSLDKKELDFGVLCLGETHRQNALVLNAGALSTEFTISPLLHSPSSILKQKPSTIPTVTGDTQGAGDLPEVKLAHRSNYSIMTDVEPLKNPDSTTGQGVILPDSIDHRLKSKSTGQISFTEPQDTAASQDKQKPSDQDKLEESCPKSQDKARPKSRDKEEKSRPKSQDKAEKSRPKSRDKAEKSRPKSRDKAGKSQPDKSEKPQAKSQDAPSILLEEDQLAQPDSGPKSQDATRLASQDIPPGNEDANLTGEVGTDEKQPVGEGVGVG